MAYLAATAFRKPEVLRKVIEEEARAGWVMLEEFDGGQTAMSCQVSAWGSGWALAVGW